jgi:hypothetical protein
MGAMLRFSAIASFVVLCAVSAQAQQGQANLTKKQIADFKQLYGESNQLCRDWRDLCQKNNGPACEEKYKYALANDGYWTRGSSGLVQFCKP